MTTEYFPALTDKGFGIGPTFDYDRFKRWLEGQEWQFSKGFTIQGDIISSSWDGDSPLDLSSFDSNATTGFAMDTSEGAAQFMGDLFVGGDIELTGSGVLRTETSGRRIELNNSNFNQLNLYSGDGDETDPGAVGVDQFGTVYVFAPSFTGTTTTAHITLGEGGPLFIDGGDTGLVRVTDSDFQVGSSTGDPLMPETGGSAAAPSYSFINDTDTGIYRVGSDRIGLVAGGTNGLEIQSGFTTRIGAGTGAYRLRNASDGSASTPPYAFFNDPDTGMYRVSANQIGLTAGGNLTLQITTTGVNVVAPSTGSAADVFHNALAGALGQLQKSTSALKYKEQVEPADWLADIEVTPTKHWRPDDQRWRYGLVADWLADQDNLLGVYENGEIENYDVRAVLAVFAAKINRLERLCLI